MYLSWNILRVQTHTWRRTAKRWRSRRWRQHTASHASVSIKWSLGGSNREIRQAATCRHSESSKKWATLGGPPPLRDDSSASFHPWRGRTWLYLFYNSLVGLWIGLLLLLEHQGQEARADGALRRAYSASSRENYASVWHEQLRWGQCHSGLNIQDLDLVEVLKLPTISYPMQNYIYI